jgi:RND family efflux transporter MFP subunit
MLGEGGGGHQGKPAGTPALPVSDTDIQKEGLPRRIARTCGRLVRRLDWRIAAALLLVAIVVPIWVASTSHAKPEVPAVHAVLPVVAVAKVSRADLYNEVSWPAEFRPYLEVKIHPKVSGFVQEMRVDFGDQVKAGDLLATLLVPELTNELDAAKAAGQKAEANYADAHQIYTRLSAVNREHPNLVAEQDLDTARAKDTDTAAAIAAAKADVEKYQTLVAYTRIVAPFDGVITRRLADPGDLIQAGTASDTQSQPLVRISDNYRLRLDFPVDVEYVKDIHVGDPVEVEVTSLDSKTFTGKITRSTQRVEEETRKMTTEVEVPNPKLELVPGMYCTVRLKVQRRPHVLAMPIEAVPANRTGKVYVVNSQNEIEDRPVTLGLQTATQCEVVAGLKEGDLVLVGPRSGVKLGEKVEPKLAASFAEP